MTARAGNLPTIQRQSVFDSLLWTKVRAPEKVEIAHRANYFVLFARISS